jgi:hypothetical protein
MKYGGEQMLMKGFLGISKIRAYLL